jgi:uncharacterized membrane protein
MDKEKQRQEISLIGRILSLEALLMLMGVLSLYYGIARGATMNIFWGVVIIPGVFILYKVRNRDWKKHWEDLEAEHKAREAAAAKRSQPQDPKE